MTEQLINTAVATVTAISPFMPILLSAAKFSGEAIAEMIVQRGGEVAWQKAQNLWANIRAHFRDDGVITGAATMVAAQPENEGYQTILASALAERLQEEPELAHSLITLLGGEKVIQNVVAKQSSWIEDVKQSMEGISGTQLIKASDGSVIINARQKAKKRS